MASLQFPGVVGRTGPSAVDMYLRKRELAQRERATDLDQQKLIYQRQKDLAAQDLNAQKYLLDVAKYQQDVTEHADEQTQSKELQWAYGMLPHVEAMKNTIGMERLHYSEQARQYSQEMFPENDWSDTDNEISDEELAQLDMKVQGIIQAKEGLLTDGGNDLSAHQEKVASIREAVRAQAAGQLDDAELDAAANKLASSGALVKMDPGGNAAVDVVRMEIERIIADRGKAPGQGIDDALTNIENPVEHRRYINESVRRLTDERAQKGLPEFETMLTTIESRVQESGVQGFSMLEQTIGALTNETLNQLFFSNKSNENRQILQALANAVMKSRAGLAQTLPEQRRVMAELGQGVFKSLEDVRVGLQGIRAGYEAMNANLLQGYPPEVRQEWRARQMTIEDMVNIDLEQEF